ncbi:MAG: TVP38/TMEM64 family protein [Acidobacteria bacterium]|nr:TVP38/TMEM64 family protein [Acidobacteriota bacterium]
MTGKARIALAGGAALGVAALLWFLPGNDLALGLVGWIRGAGAPGIAVYAFAYVLATLLLLPGSLLTAAAGLAYGPMWGTLLVSPVSVLGATLSFLLGRSFARRWVSRKIAKDGRFAAIDQAIGESGFKIVFLLRLSPILPFNLLNYALGLTRVRARDYIPASLLGMLPGTFLYVYLGSLLTSVSELRNGGRSAAGPWGQAFYWGGLAATIVAAVLIARMARKALDQALEGDRPAGLPATHEARP